MITDIEEHRFTKAQVLKLIPTLSAKLFMNWSEVGLVELQVKGKTRLLSALSVIKLAAMHEVVRSGMRPPEAAKLANKITPRVFELWAGLPQIPEARERKVLPISSILYVEADMLILTMFSRLFRLDAGQPLDDAREKPATSKKGRRK